MKDHQIQSLVYKFLHLKIIPGEYMPHIINEGIRLIFDVNNLRNVKLPEGNQGKQMDLSAFKQPETNPFLPPDVPANPKENPSNAKVGIAGAFMKFTKKAEDLKKNLLASNEKNELIRKGTSHFEGEEGKRGASNHPLSFYWPETNEFCRNVVERYKVANKKEADKIMAAVVHENAELLEIAKTKSSEYFYTIRNAFCNFYKCKKNKSCCFLMSPEFISSSNDK